MKDKDKKVSWNFTKLSGKEFYNLLEFFDDMGREITYLSSNEELCSIGSIKDSRKIYCYKTDAQCKFIYYDLHGNRKQQMISFITNSEDPGYCKRQWNLNLKKQEIKQFRDTSKVRKNMIYHYYNSKYSGKDIDVTVLDMNSAYATVLSLGVADISTKKEVTVEELESKQYDFFEFDHIMYYKEMIDDTDTYISAKLSSGPIYGYKRTTKYKKLVEMMYKKRFIDKNAFKKWKNILNINIGLMHKRNNKDNQATVAASVYAWMEWRMSSLVNKAIKLGYKIVRANTDCITVVGDYREDIEGLVIGEGLGEFKYEYVGPAVYHSYGHYQTDSIKWQGKARYIAEGYDRCTFEPKNRDKEKEVYEKYAIENQSKRF